MQENNLTGGLPDYFTSCEGISLTLLFALPLLGLGLCFSPYTSAFAALATIHCPARDVDMPLKSFLVLLMESFLLLLSFNSTSQTFGLFHSTWWYSYLYVYFIFHTRL